MAAILLLYKNRSVVWNGFFYMYTTLVREGKSGYAIYDYIGSGTGL
jgi:hypothetical protein